MPFSVFIPCKYLSADFVISNAKFFHFSRKATTAHLRNAILEKIKQDGIDSTQYESIGAALVFIFNGLAGLQTSSPELAAAQLDTIADFVEAGVKVLPKP